MSKGLLTVITFLLCQCSLFSFAQDSLLKEVKIHGQHSPASRTSISTTVSGQDLEAKKGGTLADAVSGISGVNMLKSGNSISKPVIHGLHSNRVLILNNGIRQEGQQWGAEHAPEIDPFIAEKVHVIKGAEALRYGAEALGGIIIVEPPALPRSAKLSGLINLIGGSNGRSGASSIMLSGGLKSLPGFGWRIQQSARKSGNSRTADYNLGNTGLRELNYSIAAGYSTEKSRYEAYFSQFSTTLGILYSAHVGTRDDIYARIAQGRPSEDYEFSYQITAPKQVIDHQLLKLKAHYDITERENLDIVYAYQNNHRREFDFRRGDRENNPITDLVLQTHTLDAIFNGYTQHGNKRTYGLNAMMQVNNNIPGTLSNTFIPNFDSLTGGAFVLQRWMLNDFELEAGLRYDYKVFDAAGFRYSYSTADPNSNSEVEEQYYGGRNNFHNITGSAGLRWRVDSEWQLTSNAGLAWRAPTANELYSNGLHHGAGIYEVGDPNLKNEQAYKWTTAIQGQTALFDLNLEVYLQYIDNYIYSQPDLTFRQTVSGTYPVFRYLQTNASFTGADFTGTYRMHPSLSYQLNASVVRAKNLRDKSFLPYIPSDNFRQSLIWNISTKQDAETFLQIGHQYVSRQTRYEPASDYAAPPKAYSLFSLHAGRSWKINQQKLSANMSIDNLLNTAYKDYMNRYRYYVHDMGRNISLRLAYKF